MASVETTAADLCRLYDKTIKLLEGRIDAGTIAAADLANLTKLLEKADVFALLNAAAKGPNPAAKPVADLPFPQSDAPEPEDLVFRH